MLSARGALLLFADADGATKFSDLAKLEASLTQILNCEFNIKYNNRLLQLSVLLLKHYLLLKMC